MFGRKESIVFKPASIVSLTLLYVRLGLKKWLIRAQNLFTTGQPLSTGAKTKLALCRSNNLFWRPWSIIRRMPDCEGMAPIKSLIRTSCAILCSYFAIHKSGYL